MTPEYLNTLADLADPDKLWTLPGMEQMSLPPYRRQRLDTGVALRRYAVHLRDVEALRGTGRSLLITPLSPNGSARRDIETPEDHPGWVRDVTPLQAEPAPVVASEPVKKLGKRLASLLDEDQWAECEKLLLAIDATPQAEPVPVVASEPVAQVSEIDGKKCVTFYSHKALYETPLWTKLYAAANYIDVLGGNSQTYREALATPQAEPAVAEQARNRLAANTDLLTYVLQDDVHNRLTPRVIDIAYTAFMSAKQPNPEDGGSSDWFNDTRPTVLKAIDKLREALFADRAALASQSTPPVAAEQARIRVALANAHHMTLECAQIWQEGHDACSKDRDALWRAHKYAEQSDQMQYKLPPVTPNPYLASQSTPPPESAGQGLSDTQRLDWLESQGNPSYGWACRDSKTGRGYRLYQDPMNALDELREAIDAAILAANPTAQPDGGSKA